MFNFQAYYDATKDILVDYSQGLSRTVRRPTLVDLRRFLQTGTSLRVAVDMSQGGAISTIIGFLEWMNAQRVMVDVEVILDQSYPLSCLPICRYMQDRIAWLSSSYPNVVFREVPACGAPRLSNYFDTLSTVRSCASRGHPMFDKQDGHPDRTAAVPGIMVLGTGSSVGKGTVCLLLGWLLAKHGIHPIPFKGAAGISTSDERVLGTNSCLSTVIHWHCWNEQNGALPGFLNPFLVGPMKKGAFDGQVSLDNGNGPVSRNWRPYRLRDLYSDEFHRILEHTFARAIERSASLAQRLHGAIIGEGSGSPLDLFGVWDFANEAVRRMFGVPYVLVTSCARRGLFSLWGCLRELKLLGMTDKLIGIVAVETIPMRRIRDYMARELKLVCRSFGASYLGLVSYHPILSAILSEDAGQECLASLPIYHSRLASHDVVSCAGSLDIERILSSIGCS